MHKIDYNYYIKHQLEKPLVNFLELIDPDIERFIDDLAKKNEKNIKKIKNIKKDFFLKK